MDQHPTTAYSMTQHALGTAQSPRHAPQDNDRSDVADLPLRKYEIMYLDTSGQLQEATRMARAHPAYEQAFCVLKEGAMVTAKHGYIPVEEVLPGDQLRLGDGTFETVEWRGGILMDPDHGGDSSVQPTLTRITADAMGYNRPAPDLFLGYGARILHRAAGIRRVSGSDAAFIPAADFVDGNNVLSLHPPQPYTVYQIGFAGQRNLVVNGIEVETLHPGTAFDLGLRGTALRAYLSFFPHKRAFEDFGLMNAPRLRLRDLELLD
ncbi:MAG: Hint domain-containing protein [Yoonia sp.]|uniref:Hint domain-containing protein n=1 Tax=Yoonia sp. TaxID=2212373 RepID=UPI003EFAA54E